MISLVFLPYVQFDCILTNGGVLKLGRWIDKQRQKYKKKALKPDREKLLQFLVDNGRSFPTNFFYYFKWEEN